MIDLLKKIIKAIEKSFEESSKPDYIMYCHSITSMWWYY